MIENNGKNNVLKIIIALFVSLVIVGLAFLGGFLTSRFTSTDETASFEWVLQTIKENYYEDVSDEDILQASMIGVSNLILDPYSEYYTAEEYAAMVSSNQGNRKGIGISYTYIEEKYKQYHPQNKSGVLISMVVGGSPAFRSGLRTGEFITGIKYGGQTYTFASSDDFAACIDGIPDNTDFVMVSDRNEEGYTVSKQDYVASYCVMYTSTTEYSAVYYNGEGRIVEDDTKGMEFLPEGAAYLRLDQFFGNASNEMAVLAECFNEEQCDSLILDLRGNGGGYVSIMCEISDIFTGQLPSRNSVAMRAVDKKGKEEKFYVENNYSGSEEFKSSVQVSVLVDHNTASASEALVGVLIDNGVIDYGDIYISEFGDNYANYLRAVNNNPDLDIKNSRSYGKGIMQSSFENPATHEVLKLTTAKIYWPKGETCIHGTGLTVSMGCKTVKTDWDGLYGDPQLQEAVKAIYGE